jgi:hypothetical protein
MVDNKVRGLVILGITLVVANVLIFATPFEREAIFWIAYGFTMFAVLAQAGVCVLAFGKAETLRSKVLGIPIIEVGFVYLLVQLVLCLALMTAATFIKDMPVAWALIPCVLVLAVAAVLILMVDGAREEIERQDVAIRTDTGFMRMLTADVQALISRATDDASRAALGRLAETLRYSDPVHTPGLEGIEAQMGQAFLAVRQQVSVGTDANAAVDELSLLLNERNIKAQALKQQAL